MRAVTQVLNLRAFLHSCRHADSCSTIAHQTSLLHSPMTLTHFSNVTRALILPCARAQTGSSVSIPQQVLFSASVLLSEPLIVANHPCSDPDSSRGVIERNTLVQTSAGFDLDVTSGCGETGGLWWDVCVVEWTSSWWSSESDREGNPQTRWRSRE